MRLQFGQTPRFVAGLFAFIFPRRQCLCTEQDGIRSDTGLRRPRPAHFRPPPLPLPLPAAPTPHAVRLGQPPRPAQRLTPAQRAPPRRLRPRRRREPQAQAEQHPQRCRAPPPAQHAPAAAADPRRARTRPPHVCRQPCRPARPLAVHEPLAPEPEPVAAISELAAGISRRVRPSLRVRSQARDPVARLVCQANVRGPA